MTRIELPIVVAIIGTGVVLVLSAVEAAPVGGAARRTQCVNHVKPLGLAI